MEKEFKLPELGENIESGDVVEVLVSVGDTIELDQAVIEVETDKAAIEVPSAVSGVVKAIHVEAGGKALVGQPILTVDTDATDETPAPVVAVKPPAEEPPQNIRAISTAPEKPIAIQQPPPISPPTSTMPPPPRAVAPAAPSVRRFAREIGIDIGNISGSGPGGRISIDDVKNFARQQRTEPPPSAPTELIVPTASVTAPTLPDFSKWGEIESQPMSNVRRATAEHLTHAWTTIPHVTNHDKADITELEKLRKRFASKAEAAGGKLTITAIALKVVVGALKRFPQFNASINLATHEIIYKKYYHIGVAVDTEHGLLVPVIRDVDRKSVIELAAELGEISDKARNRKLGINDMQGGSFTITNLGGIGGTHFSPIVNHPEVAILGISRGRIEPVFIDEQFQPRLMLPLALSYDHRLIDGADAARFLRALIEMFEEPFLIALEG
jgi:pyruvate dehydrogenase E2 component (dihydrolipoamide acetyltransferase)